MIRWTVGAAAAGVCVVHRVRTMSQTRIRCKLINKLGAHTAGNPFSQGFASMLAATGVIDLV